MPSRAWPPRPCRSIWRPCPTTTFATSSIRSSTKSPATIATIPSPTSRGRSWRPSRTSSQTRCRTSSSRRCGRSSTSRSPAAAAAMATTSVNLLARTEIWRRAVLPRCLRSLPSRPTSLPSPSIRPSPSPCSWRRIRRSLKRPSRRSSTLPPRMDHTVPASPSKWSSRRRLPSPSYPRTIFPTGGISSRASSTLAARPPSPTTTTRWRSPPTWTALPPRRVCPSPPTRSS
mmetsp:Transcript_18357/g.52590  ORF Transcript_18357/g.52590 Transcript_18357/m.52590 type:complete len:230 (-) Transcript_18357:749-1438(-)